MALPGKMGITPQVGLRARAPTGQGSSPSRDEAGTVLAALVDRVGVLVPTSGPKSLDVLRPTHDGESMTCECATVLEQ
jgi:hypothetical protein